MVRWAHEEKVGLQLGWHFANAAERTGESQGHLLRFCRRTSGTYLDDKHTGESARPRRRRSDLSQDTPTVEAPVLTGEASATLRIAAIPAGHPYVRSVTAAADLTVLSDPLRAGAPAGQWWPPVALEAEWIRAHAADIDVLHIHFGTESFSTDDLHASLDAARAGGVPVVFTVHDLVHPQLTDQTDYERQLDILVPGADALLTLTSGAAAEIARRWGRTAVVVPHPALLSTLPRAVPRADEREFLVGVHLKDLRSNIAAEATVVALAAALEQLSSHDVSIAAEVRMHSHVRDEAARDRIRKLCAASAHITLVEHDRLDDDELTAVLANLDAAVLPYAYGTHSGWLELCWDLAVPLVVPTVGYYSQQHVDASVAAFEPDRSGASLAAALQLLLASHDATRAGTVERDRERDRRRERRISDDAAVARTHSELYRRLVTERRS